MLSNTPFINWLLLGVEYSFDISIYSFKVTTLGTSGKYLNSTIDILIIILSIRAIRSMSQFKTLFWISWFILSEFSITFLNNFNPKSVSFLLWVKLFFKKLNSFSVFKFFISLRKKVLIKGTSSIQYILWSSIYEMNFLSWTNIYLKI